jgi:CheY-like chemotaxis protein
MVSILVADDRPETRRMLRLMLEPTHQVIEAGDGREALTKLRAAPPRLAILDVDMPYLTGIEVCRQIRADPRLASMKLIIMTASGVEDAESVTRAGADGFLPKPFRMGQVMALIDTLMRGNGL